MLLTKERVHHLNFSGSLSSGGRSNTAVRVSVRVISQHPRVPFVAALDAVAGCQSEE